jgi:hypothetical protein
MADLEHPNDIFIDFVVFEVGIPCRLQGVVDRWSSILPEIREWGSKRNGYAVSFARTFLNFAIAPQCPQRDSIETAVIWEVTVISDPKQSSMLNNAGNKDGPTVKGMGRSVPANGFYFSNAKSKTCAKEKKRQYHDT